MAGQDDRCVCGHMRHFHLLNEGECTRQVHGGDECPCPRFRVVPTPAEGTAGSFRYWMPSTVRF